MATKIFLPPGFPDKLVDEAYLHPEVDHDPTVFQWGVPDLDALRQFLMSTIGWSKERMDEILVPVIRDMNRRQAEGTQANMTHFFGGTIGAGFAPTRKMAIKSKRLSKALTSLKNQARSKEVAATTEDGTVVYAGDIESDIDLNEVEEEEEATPPKRQKPAPRKRKTGRVEEEDEVVEQEAQKKRKKAPLKKKTLVEVENDEGIAEASPAHRTRQKSEKKASGKGMTDRGKGKQKTS